MDHTPLQQHHLSSRTRPMTRRGMILRTVKLTGGAALALLPAQRWVGSVGAQDHEGVILIAGSGAEVSASPGSATARSVVAEAVAERGAARVQAAAALASADSDEGASVQGAVASAAANPDGGAIAQSPVAVAFADPDQGATAQSAVAVASAASTDDQAPARMVQQAAPAGGGSGGGRMARGASGGSRLRGGGRAGGSGGRAGGGGRAGRGGGRDRVGRLPVAGSGITSSGPLSSLMVVASALAGIGAVALRGRGDTAPTVTDPIVEQ